MTVNKEAVLELAKLVENAKYKFDMYDSSVRTKCGSAGCIGGHAAKLWPEIRLGAWKGKKTFTWDNEKLCKKLGINGNAERRLCYLFGTTMDLSDITRKGVVKTLRRLAKTGKVTGLRREQT